MATLTSLNAYGFAWNGFAFGGAGSPYQITSADGIEGLPTIRNQDDNQGFNDGMFSGRDFLGGRSIILTILTLSSNTTATITGATATGTGVITYTTSAYHNFVSGQIVTITGVLSSGNPSGTAGTGFNQTSQTLTVLNNTQFTVPVSLTDTYTSGGSANSVMSAQANYNLLKSNLLPTASYIAFSTTNKLQFKLPQVSGMQFFNARVRDSKTVITPDFTYGYITSQWTFFAPDPKFYDNTANSAAMVVSNALGRTYNRVYPLVYGGGSAATSTSVNNAGWATTYPIITITGPIINPIIGSTTQGNYITVQGSYTNSDTIVIDLAQRIVTINGASARNLVAGGSNWFSAQPGNNQFYLTGTGTLAGTTAATVVWYNAYV
jgi:Phage tail protein